MVDEATHPSEIRWSMPDMRRSRKSLASRLARRLSGPLLFRPGHLIHTEIHNDVVQSKSRHDNAEAEQHDLPLLLIGRGQIEMTQERPSINLNF